MASSTSKTSASKSQNAVQLAATAQRLVMQDKVQVSMRIEKSPQKSKTKAQEELRKHVAKVQAIVEATEGVHLQVQNRSFQEEHKPDGTKGAWRATGNFLATADLMMTAYDFERVNAVCDALMEQELVLVVGATTSVSTKLRESLEQELTCEAIKKFRTRAKLLSKEFGFKKFELLTVSVGAVRSESHGHRAGAAMVAMSFSRSVEAAGGASAPEASGYIEPREEYLSLDVSGQIQLG